MGKFSPFALSTATSLPGIGSPTAFFTISTGMGLLRVPIPGAPTPVSRLASRLTSSKLMFST